MDNSETGRRELSEIVRDVPRILTQSFIDFDAALTWSQEHDVDAFVLGRGIAWERSIEFLRGMAIHENTPVLVVAVTAERDRQPAAITAGANDFVVFPDARDEFVPRISRLLDLSGERRQALLALHQLERTVDDVERGARQHSARLETLLRISNGSGLSPQELLDSILVEGTIAIRRGHAFFGAVSHRDGEDLVIDAQTTDLLPEHVARRLMKPGDRTTFADSIQAEVSRSGATRSWDDLTSDAFFAPNGRVRATGWRAAIATEFRAAGTTYFLGFLSLEPADACFNADDHAYVELLASYFAGKLEQRWQWDRMQYQSSHDTLTGVLNRSNFRSLARTRLVDGGTHGLALVNINGFHDVNAVHGHQTGDALLVEVAARLAAAGEEGDTVGRMSGDVFGIFLSDVSDLARLSARATAYLRLFERPFSTGDRDGREFIPLSGRIGFALAPIDGTNMDALLLRADAMANRPADRPNAPTSLTGT